MAQASACIPGVLFMAMGVLHLTGHYYSLMGAPTQVGAHPILASIENVGRGAGFVLASALPVDLAVALHPTEGALALLGLGTVKVSERYFAALRAWNKLALLGLLGCAAAFVFFLVFLVLTLVSFFGDIPLFDLDNDGEKDLIDPASLPLLVTFSVILVSFMLAAVNLFPGCIFWVLSMKVAAVLAEDAVVEVVKNVKLETMESEDVWYSRVIAPSTRLATTTMRYLSIGWGRGIAFASVALWLVSLSKMARFIQVSFHPESSYSGAAGVIRVLLPALGAALGPLLLALDLATVSSHCDRLVTSINDLGLHVLSVEHSATVHRRTEPLLATLKGMHAGQGLGLLVCVVSVA